MNAVDDDDDDNDEKESLGWKSAEAIGNGNAEERNPLSLSLLLVCSTTERRIEFAFYDWLPWNEISRAEENEGPQF